MIPVFFISCNHAPKCDDEQVKKNAIEIVTKRLRYEIAYNKYYEDNIKEMENSYVSQQILSVFSSANGMSSQELIEKMKLEAQDDIHAIIKGKKSLQKKYKVCISFADSAIANSNLYINNIRVNKIDNEIKLCECKGTVLNSTGNEQEEIATIVYTAQFSEDGVLNVIVKFKQ